MEDWQNSTKNRCPCHDKLAPAHVPNEIHWWVRKTFLPNTSRRLAIHVTQKYCWTIQWFLNCGPNRAYVCDGVGQKIVRKFKMCPNWSKNPTLHESNPTQELDSHTNRIYTRFRQCNPMMVFCLVFRSLQNHMSMSSSCLTVFFHVCICNSSGTFLRNMKSLK